MPFNPHRDNEKWAEVKKRRFAEWLHICDRAEKDVPDAFSICLPETVYILGSGPNWDGQGIPADACTIALNKTIERIDFAPNYWACFAFAYQHESWWIERQKRFPCWTKRIFGDVLHYVNGQPCDFTFRYLPMWRNAPNDPGLMPGILRTGGTIAGAMLQLCYWKHVKRVILAGIDMFGPAHFDGMRENPVGKSGIWHDCAIMNQMIATCRTAGMRIESISKTALEVDGHE